jgi:L-lactate dehydrogenase complex protein LldE
MTTNGGEIMRVAFFVTCLVDLMRPRIGFAAIELLEAAGCEVVVPPHQTCCGQPAWNSGDRESAARLARKVIAEFEGFKTVVAPSGSCADHIRNEYPAILADDPEWHGRAVALASRVHELTDFLVNVVKLEKLPGNFAGSVTYHDSCSGLRSLGIKAQPRALLARLPGVELREMNGAEECCGFGGTFSVKFGEVSAAIAERKCANACATGAGTIVGGDLGCLLNIEGRLRRRGDLKTQVLHIAEVLAGRGE